MNLQDRIEPTVSERCKKCNSTKWYQYSGFHGDTPHSKICEFCCTHEGEPWKADNGKYYCLVGCGTEMPEPSHSPSSGVEKYTCEKCGTTAPVFTGHVCKPVEPTAPVGGSWESEFDKKFMTIFSLHTGADTFAPVKDFIAQTIKNREREIAGGIEKLRRGSMSSIELAVIDSALALINKQ